MMIPYSHGNIVRALRIAGMSRKAAVGIVGVEGTSRFLAPLRQRIQGRKLDKRQYYQILTSAPFDAGINQNECRDRMRISDSRHASPYGHDWRAHAGRIPSSQGYFVNIRVAIVSTVFAILTASAAHSQGVPGGAAHGFYEGNRRAGPVGAVVGGAVGGVIGGVEGVLGINHNYAGYNNNEEFAEAPPPRVYRHKRHVRHARHIRTHRSSLRR
jgi:hypothetical protein